MKKKQLDQFSEFDRYVLTVGVRIACSSYMEWPVTIKKMATGGFPDVVTTHDARFFVLVPGKDDKTQLKRLRQSDLMAVKDIQEKLFDENISLQLSLPLFIKFYWEPFENDWKKID